MKKLLSILFCCYVATFTAHAQYITIQNSSGVELVYESAGLPTVCGTRVRYTVERYGSGISYGTMANGYSASQYASYTPAPLLVYYYPPTGARVLVLTYSAPYDGGTLTFPAIPGSICATSDPATNQCQFRFSARNNDVVYHTYSIYKDGVEQTTFLSGVAAFNKVGPGQTANLTFTDWCTNEGKFSLNYALQDILAGYDPVATITNHTVYTNSTGSAPTNNPNISPKDTAIYTPGQSNIIWSSSSYTNVTTATREGSEAIKQALDANSLSTANALSNLNSAVRGLGTNSSGDTNGAFNAAAITNAIDRFRQQNTNLLSQILTNLARPTNSMEGLSAMTNQASLSAMGSEAISDVLTDVDAIKTSIGDAPSGPWDSAGSAEVFTFAFMGNDISLDPEQHFPGAMGIAKILLTAVVLILFALDVARLFYETIKTFATAQTGGIPDINVMGFNALGVGAAPLISIIFIAIWVIALVGVASLILTSLSGFGAAMAAASGVTLPSGATYLLYATTPVTLIISLAFARIILWLTAAKAVALAAAISRFLIGK